MEVEKIIE